jgi:hypothetical protein
MQGLTSTQLLLYSQIDCIKIFKKSNIEYFHIEDVRMVRTFLHVCFRGFLIFVMFWTDSPPLLKILKVVSSVNFPLHKLCWDDVDSVWLVIACDHEYEVHLLPFNSSFWHDEFIEYWTYWFDELVCVLLGQVTKTIWFSVTVSSYCKLNTETLKLWILWNFVHIVLIKCILCPPKSLGKVIN